MTDVGASSSPIGFPRLRRFSVFENRFAGLFQIVYLYKTSLYRLWRWALPCLSATWRVVGGGLISPLLSGLSAAAGRVGDGGQFFEPARQTLGVPLGSGQPVIICRYGSRSRLILDQCPRRARSD